MAKPIASISGTMLAPGVSKNNRLYTSDLIEKAAHRMRERIADPHGLPIVMRTFHDAGDNSQLIVGRLTGVRVGDDNALKYTAELHDTGPARDIAALVTAKTPALRSVSIHGYWVGPTRKVDHEGRLVETADDLEIDAVDFTANPGVAAALLDPITAGATETATGRTPISESVEATVTAISEDVGAPTATVPGSVHYVEEYNAAQKRDMAAKGQAMKNASGEPSYPIKSKADLRKAIRAVGRGGADHDKVRAHIIARAKALGLSAMIPDNWNTDGSMTETGMPARLGEIREYYPDGPTGAAGFCIDVYAGPLSLTLRATSLDPAGLRAVAVAATDAACGALDALDPDADADIDTAQGGETTAVSPDDDMEYAPMPETRLSEADTADDGAADTAGDAMDAADAPPGGPTADTTASHDHTHDASDANLTHVHGHNHAHENASGSYQHGHSHTHFHLPGGDESHQHVHTHGHETPAGHNAENHEEESAVSETETPAVETATPARNLTDADVTAIGEAFANAVKELREHDDPEPAPETPDGPEPEGDTEEQPQEPAESITKADLASLKESLTDAIRAEVLAKYGVPSRTGFRHIGENDAKMTRDELWDRRADFALGDYAKTPTPIAGTGSAPAPTA